LADALLQTKESNMGDDLEVPKRADPMKRFEQTLIEEFLKARGHDRRSVHALPEDEARHLLTEASIYASSRLSEVEARAHYVHELHGDK
jgi:hypothetical protein